MVAASRLPAGADIGLGGHRGIQWSPGGVVSCLTSALASRRCAWVGYSRTTVQAREGLADLVPVEIEATTYDAHYAGLCNASLWPLYHDGLRKPVFAEGDFAAYAEVNQRFAVRVSEVAAPGALVWVHDYQLQLVPRMLRELRPDLRIGFFLHTPFPVSEIFARLPWRQQVIEGLLGADLVGMQTQGDVDRFIRSCARLDGREVTPASVVAGSREVRVECFPVGVDHALWRGLGGDARVRERAHAIREGLGSPRTLLLGVDRLDYTKGIPHRLRAYARLLRSGALDPRATSFVQVAVPTRGDVDAYREEAGEVAALVSELRQAYPGITVVSYVNRSLEAAELAALYLAADAFVVTSLRDGMNLVAKEYVATIGDDDGALVLSEFAGAAQQLVGAWLVNPHDEADVARAMRAAALSTSDERRERMSHMRDAVVREDVHAWADDFLRALESARCGARR